METPNLNSLSSEERENLNQELVAHRARLKQISIELDHGLIEESDPIYLKENKDKIQEFQTLGAKIDSIEKLLK